MQLHINLFFSESEKLKHRLSSRKKNVKLAGIHTVMYLIFDRTHWSKKNQFRTLDIYQTQGNTSLSVSNN